MIKHVRIPFFLSVIWGLQSKSNTNSVKFTSKKQKYLLVSNRDWNSFLKANIVAAKRNKAHAEVLKKMSMLAAKVVSFSGEVYKDKFCFNPKVKFSLSELAGFVVYRAEKRKLDGKADKEIQEVFFDFSQKVFEARALMQCVNSLEPTLRSVRSECAELCNANELKSRINSISDSLDEMKLDLCDLMDELKMTWGADLFGDDISLTEAFNRLKENSDASLLGSSKDFDAEVASANKIYNMLTLLDFAYDYDVKGSKGSLVVSVKPFKMLEILGSREAEALRVESRYANSKSFYEQKKLYRKIQRQFLRVGAMSKELCKLETVLRDKLSAKGRLESGMRFMELKIIYTKAAIALFKDIALYKKNNDDLIKS